MEKLKQKNVSYSSYQIPSEILIDIFSRVPAKSIFRFRCISKFWRSTLGLPYFTELFLTKSLARPRLLFAIHVGKELILFSSPQPQNPAEDSTLVATPYNKCFPQNYYMEDIRTTFSGQVYLYELKRTVRVICNPVTGESTTITLPEVTAKDTLTKCYVGYDPINKQFKFLCTTWSSNGEPTTHRVLTLGSTGKPLWRWIECNPNVSIHMVAYIAGVICINGVVYCGAHYIEGSCMMVCFDFCSEKFSFIKIDEGVLRGTLVNYKGNLGVLDKDKYQLVLWVLEDDAGNHKWSKSLCVRSRVSLFERIGDYSYILGMTGAGEIVLSTYHSHRSNRFYIVYYNIERNTFTRVYIQGFEQFNDPYITPRIFLDYVENIKLLQVSSSAS